jgi:hypothetical protein
MSAWLRSAGPPVIRLFPIFGQMIHARYFDGERGILAAKISLSERMGGINFATLFVGMAAMLSAVVKTAAEAEDLAPACINPDRFLAVALAHAAGDEDAVKWVRGAAPGFIGAGAVYGLTQGEHLAAVTQVLSKLAAELVRHERYGPERLIEEG